MVAASDKPAQGVLAHPNPINLTSDVQSVESGSYLVPSGIRDQPFISGMPIRYIQIAGDKGLLMSASISVLDLSFIMNAMCRMLLEEAQTVSKLPNFKLLAPDDVRTSFQNYIRDSQAILADAESKFSQVDWWVPENDEVSEDKGTEKSSQ